MAEGGTGSSNGDLDNGAVDRVTLVLGGDNMCGKCGKDADNGARCNLCNVMFHAKCQGIAADLFKCIVKYGAKGMHWYIAVNAQQRPINCWGQ